MSKTVQDVLAELQATMAVPKGRNNDFGGYRYRKAEDIILGARKSAPAGVVIKTTDRIEEIGGQIFVIATASITYAGETISADAGAMHPLQKKGMDASQITGSASSYARKYALQGLFALDDGEHDPDAKDNRQENGNDPAAQAIDYINGADNLDDLKHRWEALPDAMRKNRDVIGATNARKAQLQQKEAAN